MAEEYKEQSQKEWEDAFNPYTPKYTKTHTQILHEQDKRNQQELETEESQEVINQMLEGLKE